MKRRLAAVLLLGLTCLQVPAVGAWLHVCQMRGVSVELPGQVHARNRCCATAQLQPVMADAVLTSVGCCADYAVTLETDDRTLGRSAAEEVPAPLVVAVQPGVFRLQVATARANQPATGLHLPEPEGPPRVVLYQQFRL